MSHFFIYYINSLGLIHYVYLIKFEEKLPHNHFQILIFNVNFTYPTSTNKVSLDIIQDRKHVSQKPNK